MAVSNDPNFMTYLLDPVALQNILTKACRSGKEVPIPEEEDPIKDDDEDLANLVTPVGSLSSRNGEIVAVATNGNGHDAEAARGKRPDQPPKFPPPTEATGPAIRCAILLAKDGNLMSQSEGLPASKARFYSALTSKLWQNQVGAAKELEELIDGESGDPVSASASLETGTNEDNVDGKTLGQLEHIRSMHKSKMLCVAPAHAYLVLMISDSDFADGLLRDRCLALARRLKTPMEKVTPPEFSRGLGQQNAVNSAEKEQEKQQQEEVQKVLEQKKAEEEEQQQVKKGDSDEDFLILNNEDDEEDK